MLFVGLIALAGAFVFAYAAYKDTSPADELLVAFGVKKGREGGAPSPSPVAQCHRRFRRAGDADHTACSSFSVLPQPKNSQSF